MKRLFVLTLLGLFTCGVMFAQPKNSDKANWKRAQKNAKLFIKDGWRVHGSRSLEEMLYAHYQKVDDDKNQELLASVEGNTSVKTLNQAQQWAANNAAVSYANQACKNVETKIDGEFGAGMESDPSVDNFYQGYEAKVATEINGELKRSFAMYKEKANGGIDYRVYYIVNEDAASKARIRAMERALAESEFARKNADRISKFVKEGFTVKTEQ